DPSKRKVKVLKDSPLDIPERSSQPGTFGHLAKQSINTPREKIKGPKCGQCEEKRAMVSCVQCSEAYCAQCFAAFHLKGALKKHRSVPLSASGPRQCMSPRPTPPPSNREYQNGYQSAEGAVNLHTMNIHQRDRNSPEGASGSFDGPSLLDGTYDESENAVAFQQALQAWRTGEASSETTSKPKTITPRRHSPRKTPRDNVEHMDHSTGTNDKSPELDIKFTNSLSYAERLLLKKHRRTDLDGLPTPRLDSNATTPRTYKTDSTTPRFQTFPEREDSFDSDTSYERVEFRALYEAATSKQPLRLARHDEDNISIIEIQNDERSDNIEETTACNVQEADDSDMWAIKSQRTRDFSLRSQNADDSKPPHFPKSARSKSGKTLKYNEHNDQNVEMEVPSRQKSSINNLQNLETVKSSASAPIIDRVPSASGKGTNSFETGNRVSSAKQRPPSSRPVSRAKTSQSRPGSRAKSRASSRLNGESHLTMEPSNALKQIASLPLDDNVPSYTSGLGDFLMAGVKPAEQERTMTPSKHKKSGQEKFKLSYTFYSMSPRSWKPDKSLSDAVPSETIQPIETPRLAEPEDPLALLEAKNSTEVHGLGSAKGRNMLSEYSAQYEEENETKKVVDGNISPASTTRSLSRVDTWLRDTTLPEMPLESSQSTQQNKSEDITPRPSSKQNKSPRPGSKTPRTQRPESKSSKTPRPESQRTSVPTSQTSKTPRQTSKTPRPLSRLRSSHAEDGRLSRAIVVDGDNLSKFDEVGAREKSNIEDVETLDKLEWELASQSGRVTADGQISRLSVLEDDQNSVGSLDSHRSFSRMSQQDQGYDINIRLREDELSDDINTDNEHDVDEMDLETLKIKRGDDKTKLKEFEKVKIQLQQLQEYKVKAQELHKETQQHLQAAKKEAKDVQESFDAYKDEMTDLSETVEIATLDKEMAEEKSEGLQQEVENLKEKVEELTVDLEILRSEISEKGTDGVASDYQVKQLEQQNERLRDALVKMRDLSNQEKNDAARKTKLNEDMLKELTTLKKDKEKLQTEVASLQAEMIDLKDQVDAALGAEEMVETLTERNLKLEDKIQSLEEEMADLEALHEMNEELQENARESELELREDMDLANGKVAEYKRKLDATSETIADYESTISKFRELVTSLKESIRELQSKQAEAGQKEATPTIETFDFKAKFAETKAYAKTIDMELRKLEVAQANKHIAMLQSFMPEFFVNRGGDHDAVLVLLMIPRIIGKAEMLSSQVKEKFELTEGINRETVLKSHKAEQSSFGNNVILMLSTLQALRQYESALNTCSTDLLLKIGTLLPEMNAHEKSMDYFVELLRKDTLDETVSLDLLEKSIAYFQQLYTVHLSSEKVDCTSMMADKIRMTTNACDCISTDIARLRVLLQAGQEQTEISILMRDLETCCNDSRTCARKIKRRLPQKTGPATPLNFGKEIQTLLSEAGKNITHVVRSLQYTAAGAMQQAALLTGGRMDIENIKKDTEGLLPKKIEEIAYQATDKVYGKEDNGPYDTLRKSFGMVAGAMNKLANAMENGEYDFDGTHEKMPLAPVKVRADMLRTQIADIELMKHRMATKDEEIIELKKKLLMKQEELSSQQVRLGLLEKKVENATRDSDDRTDQMQRKMDDQLAQFKKKEKQYEETLDSLQADIDALEQEKYELKERLKVLSKKSLLEGISRQASATSPLSPMGGMPTAIHESPVLQQQIVTLKEALKFTKNENIRLQADQMKEKMAKLPPLRVPKRAPWMNRHKEPDKPREIPDGFPGAADLKNLVKQTVELQNEVNNLCSHPRVVDITKRKPGLEPASQSVDPIKELIARTTLLTLLEKKMQELQANITTVQAANRPGGQVRADFSTFPTPQFAKMLHEKSGDSMLVAKICIPVKGCHGERVPIHVTSDQLQKIHLLFT
ncbi:dynactin 1, partial [Mytilus galloprovincialis]